MQDNPVNITSTIVKTFVWSRNIRLFHWLNVLSVLLLIVIGSVIYFGKDLGISTEGKILLKTIHVCVGYVFAANLIFRIILGFIGKGYERWGQTLPFNKVFKQELADFKKDKNKTFKGHSPLGKLMVGALMLSLSIQMISGLVIAGTDIYYPPFGQYFASSIAQDKSQVALIKPYSKENVDADAYKEMRNIRKPFITAHVYSFYFLLLLIPLHILAVFFAERREKHSIVSSMIHGFKYLPKDK
ncbi:MULTISPECIES: cytochrome b/b6 domain-containing protein [unclassified Colwellia]|jgi:Ni/Fe-hydrogenase 1 B-type cytochrome subunit|uniref:cytochrome b/b6 domain-containing protein n=1 Tax=unclassified Colwellia TaxID=196834 RepID=UPI0015F5A103|nr:MULTISPECIES: cytochrome b/b6 domain-containing protein [unclassified Colwellia]MBA6350757.1 cytochrome b/b6 domain-containing protein [Colwellia sp. BRX9-1]MBA6377730.1 cytochrome b/b6 domain-containing protein [Colwellia sp. BRX10-7]MBA6385398.1 cytochrome b/b6 domain-containing protein [Colwellia sp. BRX10-2]MBA6400227.1 cytochrome b/b6 domain-containing protein [Colwellia sp. BRX10-5]MBA6404106.1 cytochrome b/b6 domain-containing protein [Colwellia sp. BRX10-1]